jgi:hypothetical protein
VTMPQLSSVLEQETKAKMSEYHKVSELEQRMSSLSRSAHSTGVPMKCVQWVASLHAWVDRLTRLEFLTSSTGPSVAEGGANHRAP